MRCAEAGCSGPYAHRLLAMELTEEAQEMLLRARDEVKEEDGRREARTQRGSNEPKDQLTRVQEAIRHIRENILTLKCPSCQTAYYDFDGCCALTCGQCGAGICGWCGEACGRDAHPHVAHCPAKPRGADIFFGTGAQIRKAQNKQKMCNANAFLDKLAKIPKIVRAVMKDELKELEEPEELERSVDDVDEVGIGHDPEVGEVYNERPNRNNPNRIGAVGVVRDDDEEQFNDIVGGAEDPPVDFLRARRNRNNFFHFVDEEEEVNNFFRVVGGNPEDVLLPEAPVWLVIALVLQVMHDAAA